MVLPAHNDLQKTLNISEVHRILRFSDCFHLFFEKLKDFANDLGVSRIDIKIVDRDSKLGLDSLSISVLRILEYWKGENGSGATLEVLTVALIKNNLKACAEELSKHLSARKCRKYCQMPPDVLTFLSKPNANDQNSILICSTIDTEITFTKIKDNSKNTYAFQNFSEFETIFNEFEDEDKEMESCVLTDTTTNNIVDILDCDMYEKIAKLVIVVESNIGRNLENTLRNYQDLVNIEYKSDDLVFADLSKKGRREIKTKLKSKYNVNDLFVANLKQYLHGKILVDLIKDRIPNMFSITVPDSAPNLISRKIIKMEFISEKLLKKNDFVTLSTGIDMDWAIETGKAIVLLKESACSKTMEKQFLHLSSRPEASPVYLIERLNSKLRCQKSFGDLAMLGKFLEEEHLQESMNDEMFINSLKLECNSPHIISGDESTGKSVFLGQIGRKLMANRTVVHFTLENFKSCFEKNNCGTIELKQVITNVVVQALCQNNNPLGKNILMSQLKSENGVAIEMLLDCCEAENSLDNVDVVKILKHIKSEIKSIRLWVACRTSFAPCLENALGVFSCKMKTLDELEQQKIIMSCWPKGIENPESLIDRFLLMFKKRLMPADQNILSMPHHCVIFGKTYLPWITSCEDHVEIQCMEKFCRKMVKRKHNCKVEEEVRNMLCAHTNLYLAKYLPGYSLKEDENSENMSQAKQVNIFETFEQLLVARFIADKLKSNFLKDSNISEFIFKCALTCNIVEEEGNTKVIRFSHLYICSLLNLYLYNIASPLKSNFSQLSNYMLDIAYACSSSNYINIFAFFIQVGAFEINNKSILTKQFLTETIQNSSIGMINEALAHSLTYTEAVTEEDKAEFIGLTAKRGDCAIVDCILSHAGMKEIIVKMATGTESLLHDCIENTKGSSVEQIKSRLKIINTFVDINEQLLCKSMPPFISYNMELFQEILMLGEKRFGDGVINKMREEE